MKISVTLKMNFFEKILNLIIQFSISVALQRILYFNLYTSALCICSDLDLPGIPACSRIFPFCREKSNFIFLLIKAIYLLWNYIYYPAFVLYLGYTLIIQLYKFSYWTFIFVQSFILFLQCQFLIHSLNAITKILQSIRTIQVSK